MVRQTKMSGLYEQMNCFDIKYNAYIKPHNAVTCYKVEFELNQFKQSVLVGDKPVRIFSTHPKSKFQNIGF